MGRDKRDVKTMARDVIFKKIHSSKLIYNTSWEDPAIDRELLRLNTDSKVVMITGAGCNVLNYLLDSPREIHAIDLNPRQNALLHLKMAAIKRLEYEDFFQMFGKGCHGEVGKLFSHIKYSMPEFARKYWEKKLHYFEKGRLFKSFYYRGTAGNVALLVRHYLNTRKDLRNRILSMFECATLEEQREIFELMFPEFWGGFIKKLAGSPTVMAMLGVPRPQIRMMKDAHPGGAEAYVEEKIRHVFGELSLKDNYFWKVYLRGEYNRRCCPDYLKEENFYRLRERLERIYTYNNSVSEFLYSNPGEYTHFVLLDHQDWLAVHDLKALDEEWVLLVHNSAERAKVLMRSASSSVDFIPAMVKPCLKEFPELTGPLHKLDRVGTYGCTFFAEVV